MRFIYTLKREGLFKFKSIKNKIFLFSFFSSSLIILTIILLSYSFSYKTIEKNSIENEKKSLDLISNQLDITLNSAESLCTSFIVNDNVQNIMQKINLDKELLTENENLLLKKELNNLIYKNSVISGVILHSTNNFKLKSNNKFLSLSINPMEASKMENWYGPIFDNSNIPYIYTCKEIYNINTGTLLGYIEIFIEEKNLSNRYKGNILNKFSSFSVVNKEGYILSSLDSSEINLNLKEVAPHYESILKYENDFNTYKNKKEKKLLISYKYDKLNSHILANISLDNLIDNESLLIFALIFFIFLGFLLSFILSNLISKSITKPILILHNSMCNIEHGNWDTEIKINSKDEIGLLSLKFNNLMKYIKSLLNEREIEQAKKKEFELELIQLQIKPHFLYNSLENISALTELEMNEEAVEMISALSSFYRITLSKGEYFISLEKELSLTENYLKIMKIRYFDVFDYEIFCDEEAYDYSCLKLLIQPLVENSIYHGLKLLDERKGKILIDIKKLNYSLNILIKDNGIGMTKEKLNEILHGKKDIALENGFALKNTVERLKLSYSQDVSFNIKSEENIGTEISILIPLIRMEKLNE